MAHLEVREYEAEVGKSPFRIWPDGLDLTIKAQIQARIFRFEQGNPGGFK